VCTDLRFKRLPPRHVSARTYDWVAEADVEVRIVPRGRRGSAIPSPTAETHRWTSTLGYVGVVDDISPDWAICDGLNEAGLSVANMELPETDLPPEPSPSAGRPAIDLLSLISWLLGSCGTVADVRAALDQVQIWLPPVECLWPDDRPRPPALGDYEFTEHLAIHDATGADLVVEFRDRRPVLHDNLVGVLTNSPPYDLQLANLRDTLAAAVRGDRSGDPVALSRAVARAGLEGLPGEITSRARFVRAAALAQVDVAADEPASTVDQAFHSLELVSVPPDLAPTGDATRWCVVRDHDEPAYHVRSLDTGARADLDLGRLDLVTPGAERTLPLPAA
jgi:choloylglycine hydrolase